MSQFLSFDPFGFEATTLSTGRPGGVTNRIWAASMQSLNELEFNELFLRFLIYEILIAASLFHLIAKNVITMIRIWERHLLKIKDEIIINNFYKFKHF